MKSESHTKAGGTGTLNGKLPVLEIKASLIHEHYKKILDRSQEYINCGEYDIAVILAQTAAEVYIQQVTGNLAALL